MTAESSTLQIVAEPLGIGPASTRIWPRCSLRASPFTRRMQVFLLAAEHAGKNPTPELSLREEACECEARRDWAGAEAIYRKLLAMAESSDHAPHAKFGRIHKAQRELCSLFLLQGQYAMARECATALPALRFIRA